MKEIQAIFDRPPKVSSLSLSLSNSIFLLLHREADIRVVVRLVVVVPVVREIHQLGGGASHESRRCDYLPSVLDSDACELDELFLPTQGVGSDMNARLCCSWFTGFRHTRLGELSFPSVDWRSCSFELTSLSLPLALSSQFYHQVSPHSPAFCRSYVN